MKTHVSSSYDSSSIVDSVVGFYSSNPVKLSDVIALLLYGTLSLDRKIHVSVSRLGDGFIIRIN